MVKIITQISPESMRSVLSVTPKRSAINCAK